MFGLFDFFVHTFFDFNHDGMINLAEQAFIIDQLHLDMLEEAGIDPDEFEVMDPEERYDALLDAGLDPDDFIEF